MFPLTQCSHFFRMTTSIFYKADWLFFRPHLQQKSLHFSLYFTCQCLWAINSLQSLRIGNLSSNMCCTVDQCTAPPTQHIFLFSACQQQLPATGVPITRQRFDHMRQKFREYVQAQTLQNWKFWIVSFWLTLFMVSIQTTLHYITLHWYIDCFLCLKILSFLFSFPVKTLCRSGGALHNASIYQFTNHKQKLKKQCFMRYFVNPWANIRISEKSKRDERSFICHAKLCQYRLDIVSLTCCQ